MKARVQRADSNAGAIMQAILNGLNVVRQIGRKAGPYLLLEILLPGGSLCALLLFLWQRRHPRARLGVSDLARSALRALALACGPRLLVPAPARVTVRPSKAAAVERW
jgi:hypothetical protein